MSPTRNAAGTRRRLLQAAFREMHRNGFRAARLDHVLAEAGVTKGALYHHFGGKRALGLEVVQEIVRPRIRAMWIEPLAGSADPVSTLLERMAWGERQATPTALELGCPLHNLAQEMSAVDEGFRSRLEAILEEWRATVAAALRRGQESGTVAVEVSPEAAAAFIVAVWQGSIALAKSDRSRRMLAACGRGLARYLETLRPGAHESRRSGPIL